LIEPDELLELMKTRRSIRAYTDEDVSEDDLRDMLEAAIWAPTAGNIQPWRFVVVTDESLIQDLKTISPGMLAAPRAVIAACADLQRAREKAGPSGDQLALFDISMACQNAMLVAHAKGLGTCVIRSFNQAAAAELLDLPETVRPELLVAVGRPAHEPPAPKRLPLEQVARTAGGGSE